MGGSNITHFFCWLLLFTYRHVGVYSSVPTARTLIVHNKNKH